MVALLLDLRSMCKCALIVLIYIGHLRQVTN